MDLKVLIQAEQASKKKAEQQTKQQSTEQGTKQAEQRAKQGAPQNTEQTTKQSEQTTKKAQAEQTEKERAKNPSGFKPGQSVVSEEHGVGVVDKVEPKGVVVIFEHRGRPEPVGIPHAQAREVLQPIDASAQGNRRLDVGDWVRVHHARYRGQLGIVVGVGEKVVVDVLGHQTFGLHRSAARWFFREVPAAQAKDLIRPGDRVQHPQFGQGQAIQYQPGGRAIVVHWQAGRLANRRTPVPAQSLKKV